MLRHRSFTQVSPVQAQLNGTSTTRDEKNRVFRDHGGTFPFYREAIVGLHNCRELRKSEIWDTISPARIDRPYNAVLHTKSEAAYIGNDDIELHLTSPCPPTYYLKPEGYIRRDMPDHVVEIPWTDLIVALSKQVEDTIRTNFMGAVFIKELHETVTMIRNPFGVFSSKLKRSIPRGMTASSLSRTKGASNFWLEYRYGWKPLMSDISSFAKLYCDMAYRSAPNPKLESWSRLSQSYKTSLPCPNYYLAGDDSMWKFFSHNPNWFNTSIVGAPGMTRLVTVRDDVVANVSCERLDAWRQARSLIQDVSNVLGVANWMQVRDTLWEVLPFSFVVDWFINFNNVWRLTADSRLQRADVRRLGYSIKRTHVYRPEFQLLFFGGFNAPIYPSGGHWLPELSISNRIVRGNEGTTTSYQRIVGLPPNSEEVFRTKGLNLLHSVDGLSLFLQRLSRK